MKKVKTTSSERALSIIKSPIMTEKSTTLNQFNKYSFFVSKNSGFLLPKLAPLSKTLFSFTFLVMNLLEL